MASSDKTTTLSPPSSIRKSWKHKFFKTWSYFSFSITQRVWHSKWNIRTSPPQINQQTTFPTGWWTLPKNCLWCHHSSNISPNTRRQVTERTKWMCVSTQTNLVGSRRHLLAHVHLRHQHARVLYNTDGKVTLAVGQSEHHTWLSHNPDHSLGLQDHGGNIWSLSVRYQVRERGVGNWCMVGGVCVSGRSENLFCVIQPFEKAKLRDFQVVLVEVGDEFWS